VAPAEIEAVLARLDGVKEAAVIGIPDAFYGERILAFLTLQAGRTVAPETAADFCREHLTAQKVPSEIHIRSALPLNAVGKIDKRALKADILPAEGAA
jgi:acyl-CoA synthetase (AMP-forming)/AMP-acid ligase II